MLRHRSQSAYPWEDRWLLVPLDMRGELPARVTHDAADRTYSPAAYEGMQVRHHTGERDVFRLELVWPYTAPGEVPFRTPEGPPEAVYQYTTTMPAMYGGFAPR
jgi:hypothetical protein